MFLISNVKNDLYKLVFTSMCVCAHYVHIYIYVRSTYIYMHIAYIYIQIAYTYMDIKI